MTNDLEKSLIEVRKSYRLLYEYQSRVLDLAKYIGTEYFPFTYVGGWPLFSHPAPRKGKGSLNNWAWDWLNMYCYSFLFEIDNEDIRFEIRIYSDTGFYDKKNKDNKRQLNQFSDVKNAKTKLVLIAGKSSSWNPNKLLEGFISDEDEYNDEDHYAKSYDLSLFLNETEVNKHLGKFISDLDKKVKITIKKYEPSEN